MKSERIIIDASSRILYSSYYIKGLYEVFGKKNVSFGRKHFKNLTRKKKLYSFQHFFAFVRIALQKQYKSNQLPSFCHVF